jgi:BolA protein
MNSEGPVTRTIREKLQAAFGPSRLEVIDDSARHAGHAGAREGGESHFNLVIVAPEFEGLSRVERQRRINSALREELAGPVHALSIKALAPSEA